MKAECIRLPDFKTYYRAISNQKSLALSQKQTCRQKEQNKYPRNPGMYKQLVFHKPNQIIP